MPKYPFLLWFDLLDHTILKNVGNDIDDFVQPNAILLLWLVLNQTIIGFGFVESCHPDQTNQNFITSLKLLIWSSKSNQYVTLITLLPWSIYYLNQFLT